MSDSIPTASATSAGGFRGLPRWLRVGIIAAGTAVIVLIVAVVIRVILQTPFIPLGVTDAGALQPGSCLLEPGADRDQYTVVSCSSPHQQQVIATVDLEYPGVPYTSDEALSIFADYTCQRLLEYRLYLPKELKKADYSTVAIAPPTLDEYTSGDSVTRCAVLDNPEIPDANGTSDDLTTDLYRPMPQ